MKPLTNGCRMSNERHDLSPLSSPEVARLIAQWRLLADTLVRYAEQAQRVHRCARELEEAVLASASAPPPQDREG